VRKVVVRISSADGQRELTIDLQSGELYRFTESTLTEGDEYHGIYWATTYWSGLYATAEEAEADARRMFPWLSTGISEAPKSDFDES